MNATWCGYIYIYMYICIYYIFVIYQISFPGQYLTIFGVYIARRAIFLKILPAAENSWGDWSKKLFWTLFLRLFYYIPYSYDKSVIALIVKYSPRVEKILSSFASSFGQYSSTLGEYIWNHQQCCWFLYVETCNFSETNPQYRAPENACQVRHVLMT